MKLHEIVSVVASIVHMSQSCEVRTYLHIIARSCESVERIVTTLYVVCIVNDSRVLTLVRYLIVVTAYLVSVVLLVISEFTSVFCVNDCDVLIVTPFYFLFRLIPELIVILVAVYVLIVLKLFVIEFC